MMTIQHSSLRQCGCDIQLSSSDAPPQHRLSLRAMQGTHAPVARLRRLHAQAAPLRCRLLVVCRAAGGRSGGRGGGRGGSGGRYSTSSSGVKLREYKASDGKEHLGSALTDFARRPFPGPPPDSGPPLRILPIGGLGEIGMNCMLVGAGDRYIVIDAGLMFPDFQDLGMQKILPDTSFLHQWRDKIEALVITHGHEDHIGAMPWVVPALDPSTPIYASSFVMLLIKRRLTEYSLFDENRFKVFEMNKPFQAGPFEVEPVRVTHSIPDCCGLIMRNELGTIVHTGDWKIDETPVDGLEFDRTTFEKLSKENIALMMSDSTNVLSPGRTSSEKIVEASLMEKVAKHAGKGRVIVTQFASNLHRMHSVKQAADAAGRKIAFVGMSLNHYLEAAFKDGKAPFDPKDVIQATEIDDYDPNGVLIVTTGSQAEPRAALSMASREASHQLKLKPNDLVLYSAKVIPGNEKRVVRMLNSIAAQGATVVQGRNDNLHVSGHAHQEELKEVLRLVKPQHFLPVHGEYSFLCEHARLAREEAGIRNCSVIKNGTMLGVHELRNRNTVSTSSAGASIVGEVDLVNFYNDGNKGTGTAQEMALEQRSILAFEGIVVVAVDVYRTPGSNLRCTCRVTTRGMWVDNGMLLQELHQAAEKNVGRLPFDAPLNAVERQVIDSLKRTCKILNNRRPEIICIAHEHDPQAAHLPMVAGRMALQRPQAPYGDRGASEPAWAQRPQRRGLGGDAGQVEPAAPARPWERGAGRMDRAGQATGAGAVNLPAPHSPDPPSEGESTSGEDASEPAETSMSAASQHPPSPAAKKAGTSTARGRRRSTSPADEAAGASAAASNSPTSSAGKEEGPSAASDSSAAKKEQLVKPKVLEERKAAKASRKTTRKKATPAADVPPNGPPMDVLPDSVLEKRKKRNPRDKPATVGADAAYD